MGEKGDPLAMMADAPDVAKKWADAYSAYADFQQTRASRAGGPDEEPEEAQAHAPVPTPPAPPEPEAGSEQGETPH